MGRLASSSGYPSTESDGLSALSDVGVVRRMLDQAELEAVRAARLSGKSWAEIATHLGVTRQSAWERWRDLDDSLGSEASQLVQMRAREQRRAAKVLVPNVVGREWIDARDVLASEGLIAVNAQPDTPTDPGSRGWIVTDQRPRVRRPGPGRFDRPTVASR